MWEDIKFMTGTERREAIIRKMQEDNAPLSGTKLASMYGVSRQVIVQDIALIRAAGYDVISIGKIFDIFAGEGLTESNKSQSSVHGMEQTIEIAKRDFEGLCFVNLVDFDALWGHRRNPEGYAKELEKFDEKLGILLEELREDDLLILTADHGNDPTYTGTDHTREKVPFLAYAKSMEGSGELPKQDTFAVVGATTADIFGVKMPENTIGHSLVKNMK